ncbi:hypothetical protein EPA93_38820 [Ktedonosporobacter rubrisoli]|uniref:Uncharacterized protein n=1 Tax=Ktedonosporobacter rubrisoli TaxID=2509675 RepID=A0A4P6K1R1_KTERU|nr:hypothetical protein [Ktedonosporobacter rubrisoli]QBD81610.1 hypothetical protein EPA93_38820 [Ktedonosporobacter rubrisoli]
MEANNHFLALAVHNNAIWCDTICRSHHVMGEFHESFWVSQNQTPIYYPNLVTLSPIVDLTAYQNELADLLTMKRGFTVSIKDSFASLNLTPFGFSELFQAQWIFREAPTDVYRQETADLQWKQITSERELLRWEEAWSQAASPLNRLFLPALLHDADICFIAAYKANQIVAGAIANKTTEVVGLSNVFAPEQEAERYWEGLLGQIAIRYPSFPVVGYEDNESLAIATHVGFTILGPLRVWIKEG